LLGQRLPKEELIATGAWFFFIINLAKVPIYAQQEMITRDTLLIDALLIPAVILGAMVGRLVLQRIPQRAFEIIVLSLAALGAVLLFVPLQ
ncbi:MAG: TSUP family transporter, partial [Planctomycetota bacterium]